MLVELLSLGVVAPGLSDWNETRSILRGEQQYIEGPVKVTAPAILSPNERRRATLATRLALEAACQAWSGKMTHQQEAPLSVFASSDGDMALIDRMCRDIYENHTSLSPTVFQNSVHNAVAGYWSIATNCYHPSTSIAAGDGSFAAGLLETASLVVTQSRTALLVAFDVPAPRLLHPHRNFFCPFACALYLAPAGSQAGSPLLLLELCHPTLRCDETTVGIKALEPMRIGNPAARSLPLLAAIASAKPLSIQLPYWPDLALKISLEPGR